MPIEETGSTTPQACTITLSKFPMTITSNRSWIQQGHRGFAIEAMPKRSSAIEIAEMNSVSMACIQPSEHSSIRAGFQGSDIT